MEDTSHRAIAIVGVSAILPDAPNATSFWENITNSRYSITDVDPARWDPALYFDPDPKAPNKTYTKIGGWVRDWQWDPLKWRLPIPPRVAEAMDDGQKWAVACAHAALQDYGDNERPLDRDRTAVVIGNAMGGERHYLTSMRIFFPEFAQALASGPSFAALPEDTRQVIEQEMYERIMARFPGANEDTMPGELSNCMAGRVANLFNFHGPNFTCDAACAAALAATNAAVDGLVANRYDAVLVGGVDRNMGASTYVKFCKIGALSATGTRPYAKGADGFVMGEGAAFFLLKRLADAERSGDRIYAVLRGMAGASDGKGKGITAPNPVGPRVAIERAWQNAGVPMDSLGLMEGHGTSTRVGDVVEAGVLNEVFGNNGIKPGSVALGSVKSNIGHLKGGAGAAGLLKAVLSLHHKVLPPSLNFGAPNPDIDFSNSPFYVNTELRPWDKPANGSEVRRAGVSAFGFGGTNFHAVLEEHIPGRLTQRNKVFSMARGAGTGETASTASTKLSAASTAAESTAVPKTPLQGLLLLGADTAAALGERLQTAITNARETGAPPVTVPQAADQHASERLAIAYADAKEFHARTELAQKALKADQPGVWKAVRAQGVFRGSGPAAPVTFLYTGQGSQYPNMLRELRDCEPIVADTFAAADRIMARHLDGRRLSDYIFVDPQDEKALEEASAQLMRTEITQPAVLTVDTALTRLMAAYGIVPDMVMGHSLGEYAALVAANALSFEDALEAVSARGQGMAAVSMADNGRMAAVFAPLEEIQTVLDAIGGNVVIANLNSNSQGVIGGASAAIEQALLEFEKRGFDAAPLPVSHAFHTSIVAPASEPLRQLLSRMRLTPPDIRLVGNVDGEFYPMDSNAVPHMVDMLAAQVASPVQFAKGLHTLFDAGARVFVEMGPKKALHGFADDVLGDQPGVLTLFSNHPKVGEISSFNQALCGLYAAGHGVTQAEQQAVKQQHTVNQSRSESARETIRPNAAASAEVPVAMRMPSAGASAPAGSGAQDRYSQLGHLIADFLERGAQIYRGGPSTTAVSSAAPVVSGAALGLPGSERIFDDDNVRRILDGEQGIDVIPTRFRRAMVDKHVTRLVKGASGEPHFEAIDNPADVIKLAGRGGEFNIEQEFGVPAERVAAFDITTKLALGAGMDALRDAGIPLVMHYRTTHKNTHLPERWMLPESLRDDTGIIFASAFPGYDAFADELTRYHTEHGRQQQLTALRSLHERAVQAGNGSAVLRSEIERRMHELEQTLENEPYNFDRRFLFRVLPMGHSQMAEYIGARGPNTHINSACASTTQAFSLAEDWIRAGRCRRVLVVAADDVTSDNLLEWMGAGFLATGAAATDAVVEEAALPFDRRRHGMLLGMGACGIVIESPDSVQERGLRPICEVLSSVTGNSAFHGTRLDIDHVCQMVEKIVAQAEARHGLDRRQMAEEMVFVSHETYTPARGGSAAAEVHALRRTFGAAADNIVIANTKGLTGHAMGVGIEDTVAIKCLESGIVPPVANFREPDPELGALNLSRGGAYPARYVLRLAAGFGSQISLSLLRWVPTPDGTRPSPEALGYASRISDSVRWQSWMRQVSGDAAAELEVVQRTLRVKDNGYAGRAAPRAPVHAATATQAAAAAPAYAPAAVAAASVAGAAPSTSASAVHASAETLSAAPPVLAAAEREDPIAKKVLAVVAEITGYPTDMLDLDLDLEADLGIDTVKQAETFAAIRKEYAIPRDENLKLRDYPNIARAIDFVKERRPDLVTTPAAADTSMQPAAADVGQAVAAAPAQPDAVAEKVLAIVSEITGYPSDMLELDLDLEADLGIDTVKQAETFAAVRAAYDIPRDENLKLRDYPSIASAIRFVIERRPDLAAAPATPLSSEIAPVTATPHAAAAPAEHDEVTAKVLAIVSEITGYPSDMLDLDLDLEADLGIDTVKQAETFAAVRAAYDIPRDENLKLREYPSIASAVQFVRERRPDLDAAPAVEPTDVAAQAPAVAEHDEVTAKVLAIVSEITGYPSDMLDLDLDLEADLGIDTVKQAETFAAVRAAYGIPRDENVKLRDYPTIASAVRFVNERRPAAAEAVPAVSAAVVEEATDAVSVHPHAMAGDMEKASAIPRRVPTPVLRPPLELCKYTGISLGPESRIVLMPDQGGVATALSKRLEKLDAEVLTLDPAFDRKELTAQLEQWLEQGPVNGVYWLPALDAEAELGDMNIEQWRNELDLRVKRLYSTMRTLYEHIVEPDTFLVVATRLGGAHGYDAAGAVAPMGGGVTGFAKAYARERTEALVKAVDFPISRKTAALADALIAETLTDPGVVEVGIKEGQRCSISLSEQAAEDGEEGMTLNADSVIAVTGAAGSIVSAITADLAAASGATFYLLDLAPEPDVNNADLARLGSDRDGLKRDIFERLHADGARVTPVMVEAELAAMERANAALMALQAVHEAGGTAHYHQVDLTDTAAVQQVIDTIRADKGHIDVLLHAAGFERSHVLPDKYAEEFDAVFDVKCDGWFNLLHAIGAMPLGATVVFSSIAGRFGNFGQTDYSAANDLLCKFTSHMRSARPETRGIAIDWTAWAGIGMAARGSIPEMMAQAGIDMLAPEAGIPIIRRELTVGSRRGEIVIAQSLGVLLEERDPSGGLITSALDERSGGPMIGKVVGMGLHAGLRVETTLNPREQPFLYDHQIDGTPVLPGVMAIEAFAELGMLLLPDWHVHAVEDVEFLAPLKFYRGEPQTLDLSAQFVADGDYIIAHCRCATRRMLHGKTEPQVTTHFAAKVQLSSKPLAQEESETLPGEPASATLAADDLYRIYFHGPAYQVVQSAWRDGDNIVARMASDLPADRTPSESKLVLDPRLLELCFQTAGAWEIGTTGKMRLPRHINRVSVAGKHSGAAAGLQAIVHPSAAGDSHDALVVDSEGHVHIRMQGYESIELPGSVGEAEQTPLRIAMA